MSLETGSVFLSHMKNARANLRHQYICISKSEWVITVIKLLSWKAEKAERKTY